MSRNQPFGSSFEYDIWVSHNCDRCFKAGDPLSPGSSKCEIFEAIHDALTGADIDDETAIRFGKIEDGWFEIFDRKNAPASP